jgi:hypothetical protein
LAFALAAAAASAAEPAPVAFLGLRPTEDATLAATAIVKLSEAQRLRQVAEGVLEAASGSRVLGHEPLRAALGRAYLVDLFACTGDAACLAKVAAPLRALGVTVALAGDYSDDGAALHVRVRRLDLVRERVADEALFDLPRANSESLGAWRTALAPLFSDTGTVSLVASQPDATCLFDTRPCALGPDGVMTQVPEGEHLLVLTKEGYRRAERVVAVRRGEQTRLAVALEELPLQSPKAPDPAARLPTFEAPGEALKVKPFGSLRVAFLLDSGAGGDREDPGAPLETPASALGLVVLPRPAVLGLTVQAPRQESGWQVRGALSLGWVKDLTCEIDSAYAEVVQDELGLRVMIGWGPSIVSGLTAGTLTLPEGFGDLSFGSVGVTGSKSFGPMLIEAFFGKHKSQFSPSADPEVAGAPPFAALHLALIDEGRMGSLYGDDYPLTVGLSGLIGAERVGIGSEPAWAAGLEGEVPVAEDVTVWVASLEAFVPLGKSASFAAEAWAGQDVRLLEGALWQPARLDLTTGRHRALQSAGGWAQFALAPREDLELRLLAGTDEGIGNVTWGRPLGDAPAIRRSRLAAVNGVWRFGPLSFGLQLYVVGTTYATEGEPTATLLGAAATTQLKF